MNEITTKGTSVVDPFRPITLQHSGAALRADVIPLGANVTRLRFEDRTTGQTHDVIAGPESERDHWTKGRTFLGPLVGRYANRLPAGRLTVGNDEGYVDLQDFSARGVSLHGGPEPEGDTLETITISTDGSLTAQGGPLDRLVWTPLSKDHSRFFTQHEHLRTAAEEGSYAIFGLLSKGVNQQSAEKGYPGAIRIEVLLYIKPAEDPSSEYGKGAGSLHVEYAAELVQGDPCKATPLNLTHHWGFNLSASDRKDRARNENGRIDGHHLRMFAPKSDRLYTLDLDSQAVPTGELVDCVKGEKHDWLERGQDGLGRPLGRPTGVPESFDHFYAWGKANQDDRSPRVTLYAPSTGISLAFATNQSGVQVYTAGGSPEEPAEARQSGGAKKRLHALDERDAKTGNAKQSFVALEFAHPHATFLHKTYQDLAQDDTILRPGQRYRHWVEVNVFQK